MKSVLRRFVPQGIRRVARKIKLHLELQKTKAQNPAVTKSQLMRDLAALGIEAGDLLFIHSSLRGLGFVEGGPDTVIDALLETVGPEGTLVFPTYTLVRGMKETLDSDTHIFDPLNSPSTVGKITNTFRMRPGVFRSEHPTHSVAACGRLARVLTATHLEEGTNFGAASPFAKVLDYNGKIVGLGINYGPVTFYHVFEDLNPDKFPEAYLPEEYSARIKVGGHYKEVRLRCHNPEFHRHRIDKTPEIESYFSSYFDSEEVSHVGRVGNGPSTSWWLHARDMIQCLEKLYPLGITIYSTPNFTKARVQDAS